MEVAEKKNTKPILKKHINTIHCSNNLTLVQRKLFNALLFNAYHDLPGKEQYQISVKKICELIGYDSRDYKKLRKSILDLITTAIEWNVIDQDNGEQKDKWRASAIISAAKIEKGTCTYEFSSIMREFLYAPEIYGKIDIKLMVAFKSSYGLALYENCIRYQGITQTQWLSINIFRKLMGVADHHYQNFCDFKKRVLDIAIKEVNQYSPITVVPELRRVNKKVTCIRFKLTNNNPQDEGSGMALFTDGLMKLLQFDFGLSIEASKDILGKYGRDYIHQKIDLIKKSESYKSKKIRGLSAYLLGALKRDYQTNTLPPLAIEKTVLVEKKKEDVKINDKIRHQNTRTKKKVDQYLLGLNEAELSNLMAAFAAYLQKKDSFYLFKKYKELGLNSPIVRAMFNVFVGGLMNKN